MTKQGLQELLDTGENLALIVSEIGNHHEHFSDLMEIALYSNDPKSWRAAWMADKIHDNFPHLILQYLEAIIQKLKTENQQGKKRHFLKLISMNKIPEIHYGFLVDYCLDALTSAKEPPAVRVHAMQVLYEISEKEPDLKPEFLSIIENEMEFHSTPGIHSRGSKLAKKLYMQIQMNKKE